MADTTYPGAPAPKTRPTTVTVSSILLWVSAAALLISGVLVLSTINALTEAMREAFTGTNVDGGVDAVVGITVALTVAQVVIWVLIAGGLVVLSMLNNRGRNPARIVTWVVGGFALCCGSWSLLGSAVSGAADLEGSGPSDAEVERILNDALPSWYDGALLALAAISVLTVLAAMILLALPASNGFFRRPAPAWQPPPYGQPQYGAPQYGQPQYGPPQYGAPPYPGQPFQQPPSAPPASAPPAGEPPASTPPSDGSQSPPSPPPPPPPA